VETADRPGLLVDLVKNITDINVSVKSGEFDTEVIIFHSLFVGFCFYFFFSFPLLYAEYTNIFSTFCFWDLGFVS
jgi:hypothetical protein